MAFHEDIFPTDISIGAHGGPGFNTSILTLSSGYERRNSNWSKARARYDVAHGVKTQSQMKELIKFFYAQGGKAHGFRFKDWNDYKLPFTGDSTPLLFTTDGSTATIQIVKVYTYGSYSYTRTLNKIVTGTLTVYDNGFVTTDYTANLNTGVVTLGNTLKATTGRLITMTCEFHVPVRFDIDEMDASIDTGGTHGLSTWGSIPLIELRV